MSVAIKVDNLVKKYNMYDNPMDRLKEVCSIRKKCYHKEKVLLSSLKRTWTKIKHIARAKLKIV